MEHVYFDDDGLDRLKVNRRSQHVFALCIEAARRVTEFKAKRRGRHPDQDASLELAGRLIELSFEKPSVMQLFDDSEMPDELKVRYLTTVASTDAVDKIRYDGRRRMEGLPRKWDRADVTTPAELVQAKLDSEDFVDQMRQALGVVTKVDRQVFEVDLKRVASAKETARVLGVTAAAVKQARYRIKRCATWLQQNAFLRRAKTFLTDKDLSRKDSLLAHANTRLFEASANCVIANAIICVSWKSPAVWHASWESVRSHGPILQEGLDRNLVACKEAVAMGLDWSFLMMDRAKLMVLNGKLMGSLCRSEILDCFRAGWEMHSNLFVEFQWKSWATMTKFFLRIGDRLAIRYLIDMATHAGLSLREIHELVPRLRKYRA